MNRDLLRETILQVKGHLLQQKELLQKKTETDRMKIISSIRNEAHLMNLKVDDESLQNNNYSLGKLQEIIQKYDEILNFDEEKQQQWWQSSNKNFELQNGDLLDSQQIKEMFDMVDDVIFIEEDFEWQDHIHPILEQAHANMGQTIQRSQTYPQEEIVNTDIYRVSIRQNHFFKDIFGFPITILHPNIRDRYVRIFTTNNETLESLWCKVFQLKIIEEYFIFYFNNQQQNYRKNLRNIPFITFTFDQPNLAIHLITSQQAYVPMIYYNLQGDSPINEKLFTYYYKLQVDNIEIQLCGDGIYFYEENKGLVIIQQILAGDKIFHKIAKKYCLVKSIHVILPSKPIQTKLLESCLNSNELKFINEYLYIQEDMKFLDEKKIELPVIFKIGGREELQIKVNFPPSCPMYLLSQYFIYDQRMLKHNSQMKFLFHENTKKIPLIMREKVKNYPQIEFDLRQIEFEKQSFLFFICGQQKLLIQTDLTCEIIDNLYEINTEYIFKELNKKHGPGKLTVIGNGIRFNNNRIITSTLYFYFVYHLCTCHPSINVTFKLNENVISVAMCEDTKIEEISKIIEVILNQNLEAQKHIVILNSKLLYNLKQEYSLKYYSIQDKVDILILKTSSSQALLFMLFLQNNHKYTPDELLNSLKFIKLTEQQTIEQLYKLVNEGNLIQKINNMPEMETFCLFIYTTNYLHQQLNQQIRDTQFPKQKDKWKVYLSTILQALNKLPSFRKILYRGIRCQVDYSKFKIGNYVYFQNFLSTSTQQDIAITFSGDNGLGTCFEIDCLTGKSVSKFSQFPDENEFLIAPYSLFSVETITKLQKCTRIKLKEVACPKSLKLILWIDSRQLSEDFQFKLQSFGYQILYVNANVVDLQENLNLWGTFYKMLSSIEMKIICNFMTDINLDLLKCIINTNQYNKEVYLYTKQKLFLNQYQYLGVYKIIDDVQKIHQESNLINCHKNPIINNILNMLQLEPEMIDSRFNQQWLPGQKCKQRGTQKNLENWIGIGIRQFKQPDQNYVTLYTGVQIQYIKQILQDSNIGLNLKKNQLNVNQLEIVNDEQILVLTDANFASEMQDPIIIGNLRFKFVLQVKVNLNNLIFLPLQTKVHIQKKCLRYQIKKKEDVIIQRLLIKYD